MNRSLREDAEALARSLPRLMRQLFAAETGGATANLSVAQLRVCTVLLAGSQALSAVGRELGISQSAMTQIADRLEAAGITERVPDPGDRRLRLLRLTQRGARRMALRQARRVARVEAILAALPVDARTEVLQALRTLQDAASGVAMRPSRERGPGRA